jgi:hypothetical protein
MSAGNGLVDIETERALLGTLIAAPCAEAFEEITSDLFTQRAYRLIFSAMRDLARDGDLDVVTLRAELLRRGQLDEIGGDATLAALCAAEFITTHWRTYVESLRELATRRRVVAHAELLAKAAHEKDFDIEKVAELSRGLMAMVSERRNGHSVEDGIWAAELMARQFEPILWIVDGLLPAGMAVLAGRAKLGKSRLALQLCVSVATGGRFLERSVEHGACLYVSLEMGERMLQQRLKEMGAPADMPLKFHTEWQPADRGGSERLLNEIVSGRWRVVVMDTLTRFLGGRVDLNDAGQMTEVLSPLQTEAQLQNVLLIFINHHNKLSLRGETGWDLVADALGSSAISNVSDTLIGFYKDAGQRVLRIEGREIEPQEMFVAFDTATYTWQPTKKQYAQHSELGRVWQAVKTLAENGLPAATREVAARTGMAAPNVSVCLKRLLDEGKIRQIAHGIYTVADNG